MFSIMSEGRSVWRLLYQNFKTSLGFRPVKGKLVGKDDLGNKYFQVIEGYKTSRKHPIRWFQPLRENDWEQNLPAEWEAWLRNRRTDPPTVEEVMRNAAIAQMKKEKGDEIRKKSEEERGLSGQQAEPVKQGFPTLEGLEREPGQSFDEFHDKKS